MKIRYETQLLISIYNLHKFQNFIYRCTDNGVRHNVTIQHVLRYSSMYLYIIQAI